MATPRTQDITDQYLAFLLQAKDDPVIAGRVERLGLGISEEIEKSEKHLSEVSR